MEGVLIMHGSLDRSISPFKYHMRSPNRSQSFISRSYENYPLSHFQTRGLLQGPPPPFLSHSYPPHTPRQQPPLLPLPAAANPRRSSAVTSRGLANKKPSNGNTKKPRSPQKVEKNNTFSPKKSSGVALSSGPKGPDPNQLPKVLPLVSSCTNNCRNNTNSSLSSMKVEEEDINLQVDIYSGSVAFSTSPPPSSLPLPTFSLRPKLSCNVQAAAGIDTGATDDLRRLLRLR